MAEEAPKIETIDFDGKKYSVEDLTPRVIDGFNMLMRLQNEITEQAYQLKKSQAAQMMMSNDLKSNIKEDKIREVEEEVEEEVEVPEEAVSGEQFLRQEEEVN